MSLFSKKSSEYERGDLVVFVDERGEEQYGEFQRVDGYSLAVIQTTGQLGRFLRVVQPAEPQPKDGDYDE